MVLQLSNNRDHGILITFEGINGGGKTTIIRLLNIYLNLVSPQPIFLTRQPGGSSFGEDIRRLAFDQNTDRNAAQMLILADRIQHIKERIKPKIEQFWTVLIDRYIDSMEAYQGYGCAWNKALVIELNNMVISCNPDLIPDVTFLFDIDPKQGLSRDKKTSRFFEEKDQLQYLELVRNGYLHMVSNHNDGMSSQRLSRWVVLDMNDLRKRDALTHIIAELHVRFDIPMETKAISIVLSLAGEYPEIAGIDPIAYQVIVDTTKREYIGMK